MKLSVPGKTFLVGEYVALAAGPSLILTTEPRFELHVHAGTSGENPFHESSPAGRLYAAERAKLADVAFEFRDPFAGRGGLGASSAQFALLYAYLHRHLVHEAWNWRELLTRYQACAWNGEGLPPSGADVVAQLAGAIVDFDGRLFTAQSFRWPFPELVFTLVRTGNKLPTHEHLRNELVIPVERLRGMVQAARTALSEENATGLSQAVSSYGQALAQAGFLAEETSQQLEALRRADAELELGVTACKGCGALGADVILILHKVKQASKLRGWLELRGLEICGTEASLTTAGLVIEN
jgi:mevalonate kinase